MRSDWSTVGALSNVTGVYKRRNLDAGGEHCVELKAEVQVMLLQAEKCPRLQVNHHVSREAWDRFSFSGLRKAPAPPTS